MPFTDQLVTTGVCPVALEITPPQKHLPRVLLRRAQLLGGAACAVNVIQRPGRQPSLEASLDLVEAGLDPVWHLVTRGRSREEIEADLRCAASGGIRHVLCILGDHRPGSEGPSPTIREVVAMAHELLPGATIGATFNQYGADREAAIRNLVPKIGAGAIYAQTQPVFDVEPLRTAVEQLRERAPGARIVPMVMPLLGAEAAAKIQARLNITLPAGLVARVSAGEDESWRVFEETLAQMVELGLCDALAVMTFEVDAPPETGARIVESLHRAGL
ncbi:MAG: methylenetetrahydrofolate reductase [Dehalococcoidia bacterium]|nr:methylenetetrahydrofolate reductase [Dehalococcoidia bacterium]